MAIFLKSFRATFKSTTTFLRRHTYIFCNLGYCISFCMLMYVCSLFLCLFFCLSVCLSVHSPSFNPAAQWPGIGFTFRATCRLLLRVRVEFAVRWTDFITIDNIGRAVIFYHFYRFICTVYRSRRQLSGSLGIRQIHNRKTSSISQTMQVGTIDVWLKLIDWAVLLIRLAMARLHSKQVVSISWLLSTD